MTARLPTPGEVEEMRVRHFLQEVRCGQHGCDTHCAWCTDPWPCDAARLLALVDSLTDERDRASPPVRELGV